MNTIKTFIPSESVDSLKKFADKTQKNVEGFTYSVGKPYQKLFQHPIIDENGMSGGVSRVFHEISLDRATKNPKKGIEVVEI